MTFSECEHLVSVVFGEHNNITNFGENAFQDCYALTSITLPNNLKVIEVMAFSKFESLERVVFNKNLKTISEMAFHNCSALKSINLPNKLEVIEDGAFMQCTLERVVCNKNLKTIGQGAFLGYSKLEDVQLVSTSTSFGNIPFIGCDRLIELATAAGFPSTEGEDVNLGAGVVPYLIDRFERIEKRQFVLLSNIRFNKAVHKCKKKNEVDKVAVARSHYSVTVSGVFRKTTATTTTSNDRVSKVAETTETLNLVVDDILLCSYKGGGAAGVLSTILGFV